MNPYMSLMLLFFLWHARHCNPDIIGKACLSLLEYCGGPLHAAFGAVAADGAKAAHAPLGHVLHYLFYLYLVF